MRTGTAAAMIPGASKVKTRAGFVGVFVKLLPGNRAEVEINGRIYTEFLSDLEAAE